MTLSFIALLEGKRPASKLAIGAKVSATAESQIGIYDESSLTSPSGVQITELPKFTLNLFSKKDRK
jgi:hypothetical protein